MLFHVREEPGIERFEPLVPRECPRVTYYAGRATTTSDAERFLGSGTAVIAVERGWFERLRCCRLYSWPLRDPVVASRLQFSMVRMRNALPRPGPAKG